MRFHQPVHPSKQPHLESFFQGGVPDNGRASPNSIAVSSGSYDDGGVVQNPLSHILSLGTQNIPKIPQQPTQQPDVPIYGPSQQQAGPQRSPADSYEDGGSIMDKIYAASEAAGVPGYSDKPDPNWEKKSGRYDPSYQPTHDKNSRWHKRDDDNDDEASYADGGAVSDNGTVNPDAFLQWPNQGAQGFADGGLAEDPGQVDPTAFLDPTGLTDPATAQLVQHSQDIYDGIHSRLANAWHTENGSLGSDDDADEHNGPPDNDTDDQGYAGGGLITPPGPAGGGVKPQPATGNAGRPNFTAPDPARVSAEKNYAQNVTSRPATSPARGTSFSQPGPDGGQRGQEWYGKGNSPYGKGRKTKNG
jgi:hypothetical protein